MPTPMDTAKAELRAALEGAGLTAAQVRAVSPAVARFTAEAVRADRLRTAAQKALAELDALLVKHRGAR